MLESLPSTPEPCAFCELNPDNALLHETPQFYVIADHAPLTPGHVLLIPRVYVRCLAELPDSLDGEFERLKTLMGRFVATEYGGVTFWENGRVGQSVPHAHLHALAWSPDERRLDGAGVRFEALAGLRALYAIDGAPYFVVEHAGVAQRLEGSFDVSRPILRSGEPLLRLDTPRERRRELHRDEVDATAARGRPYLTVGSKS
jgi:diadenosine tetraphosphate (Ap4A) HIT family hydrolase